MEPSREESNFAAVTDRVWHKLILIPATDIKVIFYYEILQSTAPSCSAMLDDLIARLQSQPGPW